MNLIKIGIIVNTHGIKGELRIISDFEYKNKIFKVGNKLYLNDLEELIIKGYRTHKNYDMFVFEEINDISKAQNYKGQNVYFNKEELVLSENEYLDSDLIGLDVFYENKLIGKIDSIEKNCGNKLIIVNGKLIPYNDNFIEKINLDEKRIILKNLKGLL